MRKIPAVTLTSSKEEKDIIAGYIIAGYNLCVNSYIRKPVDFDKLIDTVRHIGYY